MSGFDTGITSSAGAAAEVELRYFGHSAFLWTSPSGARILVDPFGNPSGPRAFPSYGNPRARWFVEPFPRTECDLLLVTHPHFDHDDVQRVPGLPTILRDPLELRGQDYVVRGFTGRHAGQFGKEFGQRNIIFILEISGVTFCHLGDNQAKLPEGIGSVDVLMVPVDESNHLLTYEEVDRLVSNLDPAVVIPTHYRVPGLTAPASALGGIEGWLDRCQNVRRLGGDRARLSSSRLPPQREVWVFETSETAATMSEV